jgi:hypothetical protein
MKWFSPYSAGSGGTLGLPGKNRQEPFPPEDFYGSLAIFTALKSIGKNPVPGFLGRDSSILNPNNPSF